MNNLILYKRVCQLRDYLEVLEFENYTAKQIKDANDALSKVFEVLDRRSSK